MKADHYAQRVIDELSDAGVKITGSESSHKLLCKLCKLKGERINYSPAEVAKNGDVRRKDVLSMAKDSLIEYSKTGLLFYPTFFKAVSRCKHGG